MQATAVAHAATAARVATTGKAATGVKVGNGSPQPQCACIQRPASAPARLTLQVYLSCPACARPLQAAPRAAVRAAGASATSSFATGARLSAKAARTAARRAAVAAQAKVRTIALLHLLLCLACCLVTADCWDAGGRPVAEACNGRRPSADRPHAASAVGC